MEDIHFESKCVNIIIMPQQLRDYLKVECGEKDQLLLTN